MKMCEYFPRTKRSSCFSSSFSFFLHFISIFHSQIVFCVFLERFLFTNWQLTCSILQLKNSVVDLLRPKLWRHLCLEGKKKRRENIKIWFFLTFFVGERKPKRMLTQTCSGWPRTHYCNIHLPIRCLPQPDLGSHDEYKCLPVPFEQPLLLEMN